MAFVLLPVVPVLVSIDSNANAESAVAVCGYGTASAISSWCTTLYCVFVFACQTACSVMLAESVPPNVYAVAPPSVADQRTNVYPSRVGWAGAAVTAEGR